MIILGIDPGYERLGIAVISKEERSKEVLLFSECFKTSSKLLFYERIVLLGEEVARVIKEFKPEVLAIENLFIEKNQKTAMRVSEARGVILYEASKNGLFIKEFTPLQIKLAVTGHGKSDKKSVAKMLPLLIKINKKIDHDDEYDAIAVAWAGLSTR